MIVRAGFRHLAALGKNQNLASTSNFSKLAAPKMCPYLAVLGKCLVCLMVKLALMIVYELFQL